MKILITTDWYEPVVNGVVTSVLNLVRELRNKGHQVRVLTLSDDTHSRYHDQVYYLGSINAYILTPERPCISEETILTILCAGIRM